MSVKRLFCIDARGPEGLREHIGALPGWDVCVVSTLHDAARALEGQRFLVGLLLEAGNAMSWSELDQFLRRHWAMQWVGVFGQPALDAPACRHLITDHLYDFHTSPADLARLGHTLGHAHGWAVLREQRLPRQEAAGQRRLTGASPAIARLREQIRRIAPVHAPVLITGESGSGKELTAQAIHEQSHKAAGPFVAINCGAIPAGLIHSELFGHERGAFTGAASHKRGLIETAGGGTIFLDEIGDLPMELQANLLRFLQEGTIYRVGATRSMSVDARVIAATHIDLEQAVAQGRFREDLFYRLNVLPIAVPPLRERREDLATLAETLFRTHATDKAVQVKGFSSEAMQAIVEHAWPGNVRELINRVRRAMVLADGRWISAADLGLASAAAPIPVPRSLEVSRDDAERNVICAMLAATGQNIAKSARELGVSRMTLYRLLSKHGIPP